LEKRDVVSTDQPINNISH